VFDDFRTIDHVERLRCGNFVDGALQKLIIREILAGDFHGFRVELNPGRGEAIPSRRFDRATNIATDVQEAAPAG